MLLPIRTNVATRRTPYANYALIILNVLIFAVTYHEHTVGMVQGQPIIEVLRPFALRFQLTPSRPYLFQFITYAFLHGGFAHILGNMFFLYIFGNNVNDKLGHVGYVCFYLGGAIFSALGHVLLPTGGGPVIGASGAVAAVTGAFLVMYPQTLITILYFFFFIGTIDVPAIYFILIKMIIIDNVLVRSAPNIAYDAHLSGYAFGIVGIVIMLATGLLKRTHFDLWSMIVQWNRRRRFRDAVSNGYNPYGPSEKIRKVKSKSVKSSPSPQEERLTELRTKVSEHIQQRDIAGASRMYEQILEIDPEHVLPRQYQLDIANQFMADGKWTLSAGAYEKFLRYYANYEYIEQVLLMLGLLYSRYLDDPDRAVHYLQKARERLSDPGQLTMCKDELARLQSS